MRCYAGAASAALETNVRIVAFLDEQGQARLGLWVDESTALVAPDPSPAGRPAGQTPVRIARFEPPVRPPNIFAIGRNYGAHVAETGAAAPPAPLIFQKPTTAVIAHREAVVLPAAAPHEVDYEAELAIVIGQPARRVSPEAALAVVAGYTCANDVTARDCQRSEQQWARAKGFDTFCPLGPCLTPADQLDPDRLAIRSRLNGRLMQEAHTSQMTYSCRRLISYLSHQFTLLPGTVILTGTPAGVGYTRRPPVFLRPGDRIEVEIEGIGTLVNDVRAADEER